MTFSVLGWDTNANATQGELVENDREKMVADLRGILGSLEEQLKRLRTSDEESSDEGTLVA